MGVVAELSPAAAVCDMLSHTSDGVNVSSLVCAERRLGRLVWQRMPTVYHRRCSCW